MKIIISQWKDMKNMLIKNKTNSYGTKYFKKHFTGT